MASGKVEFTKEITAGNYLAETLGKFAAAAIIMKYPLLGQVVNKNEKYYVVDIGAEQGIKEGDRLFVSRKNTIQGEKDAPMFETGLRIGTLKVRQVNEKSALAETSFLENANFNIAEGDDVSPEPIPMKSPTVLQTPSLVGVKAGKIILKDNMHQQYLTVSNKAGASYVNGKVDLDAREVKAGHVYSFYSSPYDQLDDFILEGEFSFQQPVNGYHSTLTITFRGNGNYEKLNAYKLFMNNNGAYSVDISRNGQIFPLIPTQSSNLLIRGNGSNKVKLVVCGSHVDIYINDKFLTGFIDERYDKGSIGFMSFKGGHTQISNIKIWGVSGN